MGLDEALEGLKNLLGQNTDKKYRPAFPLPPELLTEWKDIQLGAAKLKSKARELDARRNLFWTKIDALTGCYDKNMQIDADAGMILVEDESRENKK